MTFRTRYLLFFGMLILSISSCQDRERSEEVEIMPAEEKMVETEPDSSRYSLLQRIRMDEGLSMFAEGLGNSGYSARGDVPEGPHTIFAPVNTAYDRLSPVERVEMDDARIKGNKELYNYYVVDGEVTADYLNKEWDRVGGPFPLKTRQGENLIVDRDGENLILSDGTGREARIVKEDNYGATGVVHSIDNVLRPQDFPATNENETGSKEFDDTGKEQ